MRRILTFVRERRWLRGLLSSAVFFCMLTALDASLRWIYRDVGLTGFSAAVPWIFTIAWAGLLTFFIRLLPQLLQRIAVCITGAAFSVLYLVNAAMYVAKGNFFSFSALIFAADGFKFLDSSYVQVRKLVWLCFSCGLLATTAAALLAPPGPRSIRSRAVSLTAVLLCVLAVNWNREKNLKERLAIHYNIYQASLLYEDFSNLNECLPLAGLYQYTFRDFCMTYGVYDSLHRIENHETVAALNTWYADRDPDPDNEWTGVYAGKNLLLIQLEAIDTWMITEEFMPNLWKIQQKSVDFAQHFTPLYLDAGTFNTEMIVNTGMVSPFTGSTSSMYSHNDYPEALANLMGKAGYSAKSFHRSGGDIYNRAEIHENWGYSHYYSGEEMGITALDFDTELMKAYDTITAEKPFLSFLITYSAHGPYKGSEVSEKYYDFAAGRLPDGTDEMVVHAFAHAYETDLMIGELFERLETDGLLENTVLAIYGDHYNYYTLDDGIVMRQKDIWDKNMITHTPFLIYEKYTQPQKIHKVTSHIDVLPTLVNLFGLDSEGRYYVGNDIFSENGGYAIFSDYSWFDGKTYWNSLGSAAPTEEISQRNAELKQRLQMSWDALRLNYFAK